MTTETANPPAEETALAATPGETALAKPDLVKPMEGFEDYDGSEFRLPRENIVQTAKQMTDWAPAKLGEFHNSITQENRPTLEVTVLAMKKGQWWGPSFEESNKIKAAGGQVVAFCKSSDGRVPDADVATPAATACAICPNFKGHRDAADKYVPPACGAIRKLLVADKDAIVSVLTCRKQQARLADAFFQPFHMRKVHPSSVLTTISTTKETGPNGDYYLPAFRAHHDKPVPEARRQHLLELARGYADLVNRVTEDDQHGDEIPGNPPAGTPPADGSIPTTATTVQPPAPPPPPKAPPLNLDDEELPF